MLVRVPITLNMAKVISKCRWKYLKDIEMQHNGLTNKMIALLFKANWSNLKKCRFIKDNPKLTPDSYKLYLKMSWPSLIRIDANI